MHHGERRSRPLARHLLETSVQEFRAWMTLVRTWPLDAAQLLEPRVAHAAGKFRRNFTELVPHLFRCWRVPVVAKATRNLGDDPQLIARALRRIHRLAAALHATLAVGHRALTLAP